MHSAQHLHLGHGHPGHPGHPGHAPVTHPPMQPMPMSHQQQIQHQQQQQQQQYQMHQYHQYQQQQHSRRKQLQVVGFIRRFGKRAGFPIPTLAAAQLLFHVATLHGMHSSVSSAQAQQTGQSLLAQAPLLDAACACLLVAGKAMDTAKKLRDLLTRAYSYQHRGEQQIDPDSEKFSRWRAKIVVLEREVLESIQFRYNLPLPFDFLIRSCKKAACPKPLAFRAYQLLFDLYQCKVVVEYPPHVLALTAVFLATRTFHLTDGHVADDLGSPTTTTTSSTPLGSPPDPHSSSTAATSSAAPPTHQQHTSSSLLTPASPEDITLTLLPQSLRDVLDSFADHVHAAALMALDFMIPMTPPESPLYEAYRSIKIELNQVLGIGAAAAAAAAAVPMPSPPPPPLVTHAELGGRGPHDEHGSAPGSPASDPHVHRGHPRHSSSSSSTTTPGQPAGPRAHPSAYQQPTFRGSSASFPARPPPSDRPAYRHDTRDRTRTGGSSASAADSIIIRDLRGGAPPPAPLASSSSARSDRDRARQRSASGSQSYPTSPTAASHAGGLTSPPRRTSNAAGAGAAGRQYRPVGDAFHGQGQGQPHAHAHPQGRERDQYRERDRDRDRDRDRERERDRDRERERERDRGSSASKRARRTSGASSGGGGGAGGGAGGEHAYHHHHGHHRR